MPNGLGPRNVLRGGTMKIISILQREIAIRRLIPEQIIVLRN
jgi:hypothetical protein